MLLLDSRATLDRRIAELDKEILRRSGEDEAAPRLMTIPGIGPITATAIPALAPPSGAFAKGRDFAARIGLTPLLIVGSSAVVLQASKRGAPKGSWLERMMARKPRMLVTVALANKTARIVRALLMMKEEDYTAPVAAA